MEEVSATSVLEPETAEAAAPESVEALAPILALEGAERPVIQALLTEAAARLSARGVRVLGVVEHLPPGCAHEDVLLLDLASGETLPLHQKLGAGASACSLDPSSLAAACAWVENAIAAMDAAEAEARETVVILSKFGRQEADGNGLTGAFHAAVAAELKVLTSVSPSVRAEWNAFAGEMARIGPARLETVEAWWAGHGGAAR